MFLPPNIAKIDKDIDKIGKLIPQGMTPVMRKDFSNLSALPGVT
jgi:hypothetical protein